MTDRSKMLPLAAGLGFLLMLPLFFLDWSGGGDYPQLEKAGRVVRYMSASRQLQRSSFLIVYPKGKPSEFVSWMFSEFGSAEWPPSEWEVDESERKSIRALGIPLIPKEVGIFSHLKIDRSKQIVVKADDRRGFLLIEGYLSPGQPPVFNREWPFKIP